MILICCDLAREGVGIEVRGNGHIGKDQHGWLG